MENLGIYKLAEDAPMPTIATRDSACFDLSIFIKRSARYKAYNLNNHEDVLTGKFGRKENLNATAFLDIPPLWRVCIPTGIILDIPRGHSVRVYSRSSTPLKRGLMLANAVGIIDSDYVDELMLIFVNISNSVVRVENGDRLAQGEMVQTPEHYFIHPRSIRPTQKTDRNGGMGSTGK
jgi:dUTP pyrophosphatase